MEKIRVVLADDQTMVRQGLEYLLNAQSDLTVVGGADDGDEALDIVLKMKPDIVLMDVQMPRLSGIEATEILVKRIPGIKIILLTTFDVQDYVYNGIRAGAIGYLLKDTNTKDLIDAIRLAYQGAAIYRTTTASKAMASLLSSSESTETPSDSNRNSIESLTAREIEVLQLMAFGKRNAEIAKVLFVSEGTVKTHVHAILQKLGVEDRTQAVVLAIRQKIVK
jgi:DNA-binding NarL/FixJ family response regulator